MDNIYKKFSDFVVNESWKLGDMKRDEIADRLRKLYKDNPEKLEKEKLEELADEYIEEFNLPEEWKDYVIKYMFNPSMSKDYNENDDFDENVNKIIVDIATIRTVEKFNLEFDIDDFTKLRTYSDILSSKY